MEYINIYETDNIIVQAPLLPHVSREEGGHIRISTKEGYENRWEMPPVIAIEFMRLTMIVGEAMKIAMNNLEIPVIRINFQDMGNWAYKTGKKPAFHMILYGRASNAKVQVFPEAVQLPSRETGFYDNFKPLTEEDAKEIRKQIILIQSQDKYKDSNWV